MLVIVFLISKTLLDLSFVTDWNIWIYKMLERQYTLYLGSFSEEKEEYGLSEEEEHPNFGCYQYPYRNADILFSIQLWGTDSELDYYL